MIWLVQAALAAQAAQAPTVARVLHSAAILLELGGALLVASIFVIVGRASLRRDYFTTWTYAWFAMVVGLAALAARYTFLVEPSGRLMGEDSWAVRGAYLLYQSGKLAFWTLVCRGALEYTGAHRGRVRYWVGICVAYALLSLMVSLDLNEVLVWQATVAVASCAVGAHALLRLRPGQRSVGSVATGLTLVVTTIVWTGYLVIFSSYRGILDLNDAPITHFVVTYNSYVDMLGLMSTGLAMVVMYMEEARRRIVGIESRLDALVMAAPDPIVTIDAQQQIRSANRAAAEVFGAGERVAPGAAVDAFITPAGRAQLRAAIDAFAGGDAGSRVIGQDGSLTGVRADGSTFTAEFTLSRLFDADVSAVSLVTHDVTERRQQEERQRQVTTMEAVRQLAGGLAHDFNNLLTTIMGRSQVVARTLSASSPVRDDVLQIEQAAAGAARLSRGLLALSRREPLDPERLEIDAVIAAAEPRIRQRAGTRMTCAVRLGAGGLYAHVDHVRLVAGVLAVVQNAVEAMPDCGEITIETSRALMPKHLGGSSEAACITVRDTGTGFAADARAHLFEPFFSTKGDGRGLGLATTWAFVHQSGGSVDVESSTQGTVVRLLFPIATGSVTRGRANTASDTPVLTIVPDRPRVVRTVLLAEDEASVRRSVRIFLERAGFVVLEAADGVEALAAFERAPEEIGILLTDVMMPQMGGRELAMRVLALRPDLPVVFMSGFLRDPEVLRMVNDRRVRFIAKPFDVDALVTTVRSELNMVGEDVA